MLNNFLKKYFTCGFIAACIYSITVLIFLLNGKYQLLWILFLGNALYMLTIGTFVYISNRAKRFNQSPVTSSISGHLLSLSGAAISVILSVLLYFLLATVNGKQLHTSTGNISAHPAFPLILMLIIVAALGNTITGFFAALLTSFDVTKRKQHN